MINILGLFHVGCCCQRNITCGFETSHNFARLALCRDLNMRRCEGFVFDFGCNLQNYLLNREPWEFGFKRVLVDSFHYQNHNSCSSFYDASKYKKYLPQGFYTTGREQINSKLQKLEESFRQMSYKNYFLMHKMNRDYFKQKKALKSLLSPTNFAPVDLLLR